MYKKEVSVNIEQLRKFVAEISALCPEPECKEALHSYLKRASKKPLDLAAVVSTALAWGVRDSLIAEKMIDTLFLPPREAADTLAAAKKRVASLLTEPEPRG